MKNTTLTRVAPILAALALMSFSQSAFAVSTWTFSTNTPTASNCTAAELTDGSCAASSTTDSNTPNLSGFAVSSTASGPAFASATLTSYSGGLGVQALGTISDSGSPQHAVDNSDYTDAVVLKFGSTHFDLDSIKIGWNNGGDADVSIFRYTGSESAPTPVGTSISALASDGWQLVGNYANLSTTEAKIVNYKNQTSSWWMISAYSNTYGSADGSDQESGVGIGSKDYFKLLSVSGTAFAKTTPPPQGVPEPGSLALLGLGLMGVVAARRRKQVSL